MSFWRKLAMVFAILLLAIGLWISGYDLWFIRHFGFDYNDVIYTGGEDFADWPTGERPLWADLPLYLFVIPIFIAGSLILRSHLKPRYRWNIRLGTE